MKKFASVMLFVLIGIGSVAVEAKPKIGMKRATQIATSHVHGTVTSKELEKEHGKWIYSFDIRTGKGKITEVNVDAYSGKVLGVERENAKTEAAEEKNEKKEKH
jgi:siroheme synthase (precorrin-2 oxidase/ferrochelatase)